MNLSTSLESLRGVGAKTAAQLASAGLVTVGDLMTFYPRTYEDYSHTIPIADSVPGKIAIKATCAKVDTRRVRRGVTITTATLKDSSGEIKAVWFNQPYRRTQLAKGGEFLFSGTFEFRYNRYQLTNPHVEAVSGDGATDTRDNNSDVSGQSSSQIIPVYRALVGLKSALVRKLLRDLRSFMAFLPETLPDELVQNEHLVSYAAAIEMIHFPSSQQDIDRAKERLAYEELFQLLLASERNKKENEQLEGWHIPFDQHVVKTFVEALPFALTNAQRRAAWDILQDFEKAIPMNRLLQGDVGSGKTVVAGLAARQAAAAGFQTALMAPTELLATQHAETLSALLHPFGVTVGLLTGSVKGKARQELYKAIENGDVDVVIGTHALIQGAVQFHSLGFVVIDEQHRFGVAQRQELLKKSKRLPHLLAMTATPIPRSLALTAYGELAISVINEKPSNRKEIITKLWSPNSRAQLYERMDAELQAGRQAYVVCSLIDDNEANELRSVEAEYTRLRTGVFTHRRIGLLHGRLSAAEKEQVMQQFVHHEVDILVSTTVVEVGVDVPNATVMLIENGDHFGLAQLHQLRGRVGRSAYQSYCYIVPSDSREPSQRLKEIEKSNDGFYLAERDLQLRGPGEIYGKMQHGSLNLQIASLGDTKLIARAQRGAQWFVTSGQNLLHYKGLAKRVTHYQRLTTLN